MMHQRAEGVEVGALIDAVLDEPGLLGRDVERRADRLVESFARKGREFAGVISLGVRPTFAPPVELLEAHLFDFDEDLYGRTIEVALQAFIRPEEKFADVAALAARMKEDVAEARRLLG